MSVKELKQEIEELKKEVQRLEDENSSLWFLMGELEKSNIANLEYQKQFLTRSSYGWIIFKKK